MAKRLGTVAVSITVTSMLGIVLSASIIIPSIAMLKPNLLTIIKLAIWYLPIENI
jgi:hypothetical protein